MIHIDTFRINIDRWCRRTWQAEWTGCQRAVRAWTERGVYRKALRHFRREERRWDRLQQKGPRS